jgi:hypothetical protein
MTSREGSPDLIDKGKGRAKDPTERTPLLFNGTSSSHHDERIPASLEVSHRRLRSRLTLVFLTSLTLCVIVFVAAALLAWTYAAKISAASPDKIVQNALVFHGPENVNILNVTSTGMVWVEVEARVGVDAGSVIGVNSDPEQDGMFRRVWKSVGRWGVGRVKEVTVNLTSISIMSDADPSIFLISIDAQPISVPLTTNPPSDKSWLTPISTTLLIQPTNDTNALLGFVRNSWQQGSLNMRVDVKQASIRGGSLDENSWRSQLHKELFDVQTILLVESTSLRRSIGLLMLNTISSTIARTTSPWRQFTISFRRRPRYIDIIRRP